MMKKIIKGLIVAKAFAFLFILHAPALLAKDSEVTITSNYLEYQEQDKYMVAKDSVVVVWEGKTLKADSVEMDTAKNYIIAKGSAVLVDAGNVLRGEIITYDLKNKTGAVLKVHGAAAEWFFSAIEARKLNETQLEVYHPRFTTCNLQRPHYTIKATSAKITLGHMIILYNPVLFFRKVPVFYFPILPIGLGPHKFDTKVEPGYNSTDGLILKAILGYTLNEHVYARLFYDYYSIRGSGVGGELDYNSSNVRGTLYTYDVKDNISKSERYTLTASHYQKINSTWTAQAAINFQSDSAFNNEFVSDNWNKAAQHIDSSVSLTRQVKASNFRIYTSRTDTLNPLTNNFEPTSIIAPGFTYTRFPVALTKLSIYQSYVVTLANNYDPNSTLYTWGGSYTYNLSKSIRINRNLSLNPQVGFTESWVERTSTITYNNGYQTITFANITARQRPLSWVDIDYAYKYSLRSKYNTIDTDSDANDYGVQDNSLSLLGSMYLTKRTTLRSSFSYGLQDYRTAPVFPNWWDRLSLLTNEFTWLPSYYFNVYVKETSIIHPMIMQAIQTLFNYSVMDKFYITTGFFYQAATPGQFDLNFGGGFTLPNNMTLDYTLNSTEYYDLNQFEPISQQIKITKELHCWLIALRYRIWQIEGKYSDEIYFQFQLNSIKDKKASDAMLEKEREFYPWR